MSWLIQLLQCTVKTSGKSAVQRISHCCIPLNSAFFNPSMGTYCTVWGLNISPEPVFVDLLRRPDRFPAWWAGTTTLFLYWPARLNRLAKSESIPGLHKRWQIRALVLYVSAQKGRGDFCIWTAHAIEAKKTRELSRSLKKCSEVAG